MKEKIEKLLSDANNTSRDYVQEKLAAALKQNIFPNTDETKRLVSFVLSCVTASHQNNLKILTRSIEGLIK
jgi:hypothetical protein